MLGLKLDSSLLFSIESNLDWGQNWCLNKHEVRVIGKTAKEPDEGLLKLIVALGRDVVVLQVLLSVESDLSGFDSSVLLVDLVSDKDDGDVIADPGEVLVPLGDILVGDSGGDIEHENGGMSSNIVSFSESS